MTGDPAADHRYMARALQLARRGLHTTHPNPRVGCVLVSADGHVVGEGWHARAGGPHAEVMALAAAGSAARGATAYVSLEPCCHTGRTPPCTDQLIAAGVARVVYALRDPNPQVAGQGEQQLQAAGISVTAGVLEGEARELNAGFVSRMQRGRPWVRSKIGSSLDGRTALASGRSQWITGEAARADVQRWRASSAAILTGSGTIIADDPRLNVRLPEPVEPDIQLQPLRVVVESALKLTPQARLFAVPGPVLVAYASDPAGQGAALGMSGASLVQLPGPSGRVDLVKLMSELAGREINEVLVEAGPTLNGALLQAGLLDEVIVYMAGCVLGSDARGMFADLPLTDLQSRPLFRLHQLRHVGDDLRLVYRPVTEAGER